jgi:hypothetical protein
MSKYNPDMIKLSLHYIKGYDDNNRRNQLENKLMKQVFASFAKYDYDKREIKQISEVFG